MYIPTDNEIESLARWICEVICEEQWDKEYNIYKATYKLTARNILIQHPPNTN